jgi:two-component system, chemotaxis family, response regulator Rcp1
MSKATARTYEILLVEDNTADALLLQNLLKEWDGPGGPCNVRWLKNCAEIISHLRTPEMSSYRPDLIVLDYRMPMNGGRALADLKADPDYLHIPIVVLTGSVSPADVYDIYRRGANCCYHKPSDLDEFHSLVKMLSDHWLTKICSPNHRSRS